MFTGHLPGHSQVGRYVATSFKQSSGQSYKGSTIINYDSRVVPDLKIPQFSTLELLFTVIEPTFIRLTIGFLPKIFI